jgi:hypothetical protein
MIYHKEEELYNKHYRLTEQETEDASMPIPMPESSLQVKEDGCILRSGHGDGKTDESGLRGVSLQSNEGIGDSSQERVVPETVKGVDTDATV